MPAYASVCQRMPPCLKRIQPMPNVPLAYVSVYQRMSDIFHTLAYASTIRYSVTGPIHRLFDNVKPGIVNFGTGCGHGLVSLMFYNTTVVSCSSSNHKKPSAWRHVTTLHVC